MRELPVSPRRRAAVGSHVGTLASFRKETLRSSTRESRYNLICVAHPDDETIFFGGLLLESLRASRSKSKTKWHVLCATDANADGHGKKRKSQFLRACRALGVSATHWLGYPDIYEKRLPVEMLAAHLRALPPPTAIYTHGAIGEYGHPHHQDVCVSVHRAFAGHPHLYSVAYNCFPDKRVQMNRESFAKKARLLTDVYGSETARFLNLLPATFCEGFVRLNPIEVEALYAFFTSDRLLDTRRLDNYGWLADDLRRNRLRPRPF